MIMFHQYPNLFQLFSNSSSLLAFPISIHISSAHFPYEGKNNPSSWSHYCRLAAQPFLPLISKLTEQDLYTCYHEYFNLLTKRRL